MTETRARRKLLVIGLLLTGVYSLSYLFWFWSTPFGEVPILDGRENLSLARQIATAGLPSEPFFRAMLYPALLSLFAGAGLGEHDLLLASGLLGVLFHCLTSLLIFRCAEILWSNTKAACLSGLLFGLYPVAVYFSVEPLDTTFSLFLQVLALYWFLRSLQALQSSGKVGLSPKLVMFCCGVAAALATVARPNFLPILVCLPLATILFCGRGHRLRLLAILMAGILPILFAYGVWQKSVCGHFGILPWQGGYSLWVANSPDANGRYYAQKTLFAYGGEHQNPARLESEKIYREETGRKGAVDGLDINRYWRGRTRTSILNHPGDWIQLEFRKLYFFFNNFEQYNNKTYSFHKARSPILSWNPLGWGLVLCLGCCGLFAAFRLNRRATAVLLLLGLAYLGGGLLFFAGDRFRIPLLPFVVLLAGGSIIVTNCLWNQWNQFHRISCVLAVFVTGLVTYSRFAGVHDTSTYLQDRMLLATASLQTGRDAEAEGHAQSVLREAPDRTDATHIVALAKFNQHLAGTRLITTAAEWGGIAGGLEARAAFLVQVRWTQAVAQWNANDRASAVQTFRTLTKSDNSRVASDSLAILILTGSATPEETQRLRMMDWKSQGPYFWMAKASLEGEPFEAAIRPNISSSDWASLKDATNRLFPKENRP